VVLVCEGGPSGRVTLPATWTDRAPAPADNRLTMDGLVELACLVEAIQHPRVVHQNLP
jgi:hypothetical protein